MISAADVQESPGQPSAKSSGSLFRLATLAEDRAHHAAQTALPKPERTNAGREAAARRRGRYSPLVDSTILNCTTGSTKVMCNVIGPLEPSSNTRSLLRVAPNPITAPCLPLRRGPAASRTITRSPAVQSWSVLSLAYATFSVPGLYPSQFQPRRKRHAVNDLHIGSIQGSDTPRNADSHNRGPTASQMLCVQRALPGGSGPD